MWRPVCCRFCAKGYVYRISSGYMSVVRSNTFGAVDGSANHAAQAASGAMRKKLVHGCEPFPCPNCGRYQTNMVALLRGRLWKKVLIVLAAAYLLTAVALSLAESARWLQPGNDLTRFHTSYAFPAAIVGAVASFVRIRYGYDPNRAASARAWAIAPTEQGPFRVDESV